MSLNYLLSIYKFMLYILSRVKPALIAPAQLLPYRRSRATTIIFIATSYLQ